MHFLDLTACIAVRKARRLERCFNSASHRSEQVSGVAVSGHVKFGPADVSQKLEKVQRSSCSACCMAAFASCLVMLKRRQADVLFAKLSNQVPT